MKSNIKLNLILIYLFIILGQVFSQEKKKDVIYILPDREEPLIVNIREVYSNIKDNLYNLNYESKVNCKFIVSESGSIIDFSVYSERYNYINLLVKDLQKLLFAPRIIGGKAFTSSYFLSVNFTKNCILTEEEIFSHLLLSNELIVPIKE